MPKINWKQFAIGLVVIVIIPLIGYQFHCLVQADQENEQKIEESRKDIDAKLKKKTDNETLKLYIEMMQKDNQMIQKTLQMQIDSQKEMIKKIEK